jgi:hypothetical protein
MGGGDNSTERSVVTLIQVELAVTMSARIEIELHRSEGHLGSEEFL